MTGSHLAMGKRSNQPSNKTFFFSNGSASLGCIRIKPIQISLCEIYLWAPVGWRAVMLQPGAGWWGGTPFVLRSAAPPRWWDRLGSPLLRTGSCWWKGWGATGTNSVTGHSNWCSEWTWEETDTVRRGHRQRSNSSNSNTSTKWRRQVDREKKGNHIKARVKQRFNNVVKSSICHQPMTANCWWWLRTDSRKGERLAKWLETHHVRHITPEMILMSEVFSRSRKL